MAEKHQVVIVGGGPAGLTAAIYLRRAGYEVLLLEKEEGGGQIRISNEVVNYPGIEKTDGETLMETMRRQAVKFGAQIRREKVVSVSLSGKEKVIQTENAHYEAPVVVYGAGSVPRKLDFPGESKFAGRGIAYCATCDGELFRKKPIFVVGGGYAAAEEAMYLTRYSKPVVMIIREPDFTCAKELADRVKRHPHIKIEYHTEILRAEGEETIKRLVFKNSQTGKEWEFESAETIGVFIFAGYLPQTALVKNQLACDVHGYLVVDDGKRTNLEGVYGIGDVCRKKLRQLVTAVADGAMAAETIVLDYPLEKLEVCGNFSGQREGQGEAPSFSMSEPAPGEEEEEGQFTHILPQIQEVESRFASSPHCKVYLDETELSRTVRRFMEELAETMPKVSVTYENVEEGKEERAEGKGLLTPCISIFSENDKVRGIHFHGTPGGHEFSTFLSALYQAAGPGKPLEENVRRRVEALCHPVLLEVAVTLNCTKCPKLAAAATVLASHSHFVTTHIINIAQFPSYKEKNQIFSVPFLRVNENRIAYGVKTVEELMTLIEEVQEGREFS
ncbi:MAG: FAD-dependent oxidoreductase [Eubacteriales bacterium]|nr:FAD-dependent oxidoreductase [Eubacteriales bacterium]